MALCCIMTRILATFAAVAGRGYNLPALSGSVVRSNYARAPLMESARVVVGRGAVLSIRRSQLRDLQMASTQAARYAHELFVH